MSDDLRSKIAKSIYRNLVDGITDSTWEIQDNDFKNLWLGVADGVIRELKLIDGDALTEFVSDIQTAFDIGTTDV